MAPMSEVAGRMSVQAGAHHLEKAQGGRGILLGGVPGVAPAKVLVIGGGVVGGGVAGGGVMGGGVVGGGVVGGAGVEVERQALEVSGLLERDEADGHLSRPLVLVDRVPELLAEVVVGADGRQPVGEDRAAALASRAARGGVLRPRASSHGSDGATRSATLCFASVGPRLIIHRLEGRAGSGPS